MGHRILEVHGFFAGLGSLEARGPYVVDGKLQLRVTIESCS